MKQVKRGIVGKITSGTVRWNSSGVWVRARKPEQTELEYQFSTAEVAARVLDMHGEANNAHVLDLWFDVFNFQYQKGVCQRNKGNVNAIENYQSFITKTYR